MSCPCGTTVKEIVRYLFFKDGLKQFFKFDAQKVITTQDQYAVCLGLLDIVVKIKTPEEERLVELDPESEIGVALYLLQKLFVNPEAKQIDLFYRVKGDAGWVLSP
jgi:hypothetical protein